MIHPKGIKTSNNYSATNTFLSVSLFTIVIVFYSLQHLHTNCQQHLVYQYQIFPRNQFKIFHVQFLKYMEILFMPFLHQFINCFRKTAMCYKSSMNNV